MLFDINLKGNSRKANLGISLEKEDGEPGFFEGLTNLFDNTERELIEMADEEDAIIDELESTEED